ncbi:SH3 domain-binding glutamic acid-rich protein homolog [Nilaparvata lugens]|uniref:SH3 domain-binding glutamic acid-rich protein homolog n=1 Tax=Nilaparvata lugens TaxID=108931 RepID=UPI000B989953|nr:SH3 domain-binding glutamic acid-rich protein homolog [Nilaparvata lugens]
MVVKVYISGISGNKEVKKRQQRVLMILDSKNIGYTTLDITEPGKESDKEYMQQNSKAKDSKYPLPPQIFNDDDYCGDYDEFDLANENDELEKFLRIPVQNGHLNGTTSSREGSTEGDQQVPQSHEELGRIDDQLPEESTLDKFGVAVEDDYKMEEDTKPAEEGDGEQEESGREEEKEEELDEKENDSDELEGEE